MTAIARKAGLARESLYKALSLHGNPEFATVLRVLGALGVRLKAVPLRVSRRAATKPALFSRHR